MPFQVRPFQAALDVFRASPPPSAKKKKEKKLHEGTEGNYDTLRAYSYSPLGEWPKDPPVTTLYQQKDPFGYSEKVLTDPKSLVSYCNFPAVGTWNANGSGRWLSDPAGWILVDVELTQEQADEDYEGPGGYLLVIFALWRVEEGYAAGVWRDGDGALLAQVMGLDAWPDTGWQPCKVWYGE